MFIATGETSRFDSGFMKFIPLGLRRYLYNVDTSSLEELRIRAGLPVSLRFEDGLYYLGSSGRLTRTPINCVIAGQGDISDAMELVSGASVYAVEEEIKSGYITIEGGHRIGICGSAVVKNGSISFLKNISGLNYRFAREVAGAADGIIDTVYHGGAVRSTLIISPPGQGKTTLLRDLIRQLSGKGVPVSVVDERKELCAMHEGYPGFDLGYATDVIDNCDKAEGMLLMLRSMSPRVLATDEIGRSEDFPAIEKAAVSGVAVLATIHGAGLAQIRARRDMAEILPLFDCCITLREKQVEQLWLREERTAD